MLWWVQPYQHWGVISGGSTDLINLISSSRRISTLCLWGTWDQTRVVLWYLHHYEPWFVLYPLLHSPPFTHSWICHCSWSLRVLYSWLQSWQSLYVIIWPWPWPLSQATLVVRSYQTTWSLCSDQSQWWSQTRHSLLRLSSLVKALTTQRFARLTPYSSVVMLDLSDTYTTLLTVSIPWSTFLCSMWWIQLATLFGKWV